MPSESSESHILLKKLCDWGENWTHDFTELWLWLNFCTKTDNDWIICSKPRYMYPHFSPIDQRSIGWVWLSHRVFLPSVRRFCVTARSFDHLKSIHEYTIWIDLKNFNTKLKNNSCSICYEWNDLSVTQMHSNVKINTLGEKQTTLMNLLYDDLNFEFMVKSSERKVIRSTHSWSTDSGCHPDCLHHQLKGTVWQPDHLVT